MLRDVLTARRDEILQIAARYGAHNVRLFGSVVRNEEGPDSDIDFLVDFEPGRSLFDHSGLVVDLRELLGRPVDVVPAKTLHWFVRDRVLQQAQPL